jgi:DNA-binding NarL/FixJ family response regulator
MTAACGSRLKFPSSLSGIKRMTGRGNATKATVLLMENKPMVRTGVTAFLTEAGFDVIEAENTGEAWTLLEQRPDVRILLADLDVSTRGDGLELARRVHDRWPSLGLVMTSDHVRHLAPADVPGNGCFLPRPLPAEMLLHEVRVAAQP